MRSAIPLSPSESSLKLYTFLYVVQDGDHELIVVLGATTSPAMTSANGKRNCGKVGSLKSTQERVLRSISSAVFSERCGHRSLCPRRDRDASSSAA